MRQPSFRVLMLSSRKTIASEGEHQVWAVVPLRGALGRMTS
jgi:hypothetical protein